MRYLYYPSLILTCRPPTGDATVIGPTPKKTGFALILWSGLINMQAIHWAADNCDVDALRRELERGVDPDLIQGTSGGWTPLQFLPFSSGGHPKSYRRGRLGELRAPTPRQAHRDAHADADAQRRTPPLAPSPVAAPARPARGPPEDRRVRVPCGILLRERVRSTKSSLRILIFWPACHAKWSIGS